MNPSWTSARTAPAPRSKLANVTTAPARSAGGGCTLSHASVITPRVPSLPSSSRSGLGPAPEAGRRRDWPSPAALTRRTDSTRSSMWVARVEKWPAARVASQPPTVERSNDCG